ncbi:MAG: hypothetical protein IH933_05570 [Euryarchaeota archaeon]|nr:hypothetical protein [Euryarchaeota archaeon]
MLADIASSSAPRCWRCFGTYSRQYEPFASEYSFDSSENPTTLSITLSDGFHGPERFDIRWSRRGYYSFHYREPDADLDFRFDRHPNPHNDGCRPFPVIADPHRRSPESSDNRPYHSPEKHFHPPPDAARADAEPSCIEVELPDLVALAVVKAWRHGYESEDMGIVNTIENPP